MNEITTKMFGTAVKMNKISPAKKRSLQALKIYAKRQGVILCEDTHILKGVGKMAGNEMAYICHFKSYIYLQ